MDASSSPKYPYTPEDAAQMVGNGIRRNAIQRWIRRGEVKGFYQRETGARMKLSADGVLEVWYLWAPWSGLDPEADMPDAVRSLLTQSAVGPASNTDDTYLTVKIVLPRGARLEIVQQG